MEDLLEDILAAEDVHQVLNLLNGAPQSWLVDNSLGQTRRDVLHSTGRDIFQRKHHLCRGEQNFIRHALASAIGQFRKEIPYNYDCQLQTYSP